VAAGGGAFVRTIVAPTAAQAQSACVAQGGVCTTVGQCCALPNATVVCTGGTCQVGTCNTGFGNCTNAPGCETNLTNSKQNCGACGVACSGSSQCVNSVCTSDRNVKRQLRPVDATQTLQALAQS
jgi:hypothetical protein